MIEILPQDVNEIIYTFLIFSKTIINYIVYQKKLQKIF